MSQDILDTNFSGLSTGDFILLMHIFADKIAVHPSFTGPCPEYVSGSEKLMHLAEQLFVLDRAAAGHDKDKMAEKKALRAESEQRLTFNANHLVMLSQHRKEPELLLNAGYELKHKSYSRSTSIPLPGVPTKFTVKNGSVPGTVIATVNRPQNFRSVELQYTEADPLAEASWRSMEIFYQCRMERKGLDSVKKYHFRARYQNAAGTGPWSAIVTLVVV
ncbi:MAG: hypothetical protein A2075_14615 [Geobacteraceae bacterium GWC2_58_44]|nr:MAG: hypothetical protein A2075_14615 [Geobacteraceae bacterium GWC2_58_44]HBG06744.1 hypothetical protein [Geobacter sp.]